MSIEYNHVRVHIDVDAVVHNYRLLSGQGTCVAPVIKSDAYGHGLPEVACALHQAGAQIMAAGTVDEAVRLKKCVPQLEVFSLLGPLSPAEYRAIGEHDIVPFVSSFEQLLDLEHQGRRSGVPVQVALKFDTGMSRLGFDVDQAVAVASSLDGLEHVRAAWVCSHLATADDPDQAGFVREQHERFVAVLKTLRSRGFGVRASLVNSAGLLAYPDLHHDLQRPGIALYGASPYAGTAWAAKGKGLRPCMEVCTSLLQVRAIRAGQSVSYGRTFTATKPMRIGIVGIGYADNYSRGLSGQGYMLVQGQRVPVLGRVCMQMTAVDVSAVPRACAGEEVVVLGRQGHASISVEDLAQWWGTISYEVFCVLGQNPRVYSRREESGMFMEQPEG